MKLDRPKDKASLEPPRPALQARLIGPAEILAYLRQHPDFLIEHDELLEVLTPPALNRGERIVDMQHFMLERQRAEITRLKTQQRTLIATTRANLASQSRIHSAVLTLLSAHSFEELIQVVTTDLAVLLDADVVTIGVEQIGPQRPRLNHQGVQILDAGTVDGVLGPEREVALLSDITGDPKLFGNGAGLVRSAAILRLAVSASAPPGLLCIGTRRSGKFHPGQGTELLGFLARALAVTIAAWLDLPA
ncbi:MAG TPA: DUF484 family protein [Stellaceae bacterium]|nr:DUF484 family protein [Stellaceae bacterium]